MLKELKDERGVTNEDAQSTNDKNKKKALIRSW
jgi:hypothetical protein